MTSHTPGPWLTDPIRPFSVDAKSPTGFADALGNCPIIWLRYVRPKERHTSGPWLHAGDRLIAPGVIVKGEAAIVGSLSGCFEGEQSYNALLIAAAPELLEAVEDLVSRHACECGHPACEACRRTVEYRELIRKAKGKE